MPLCGLFWDQDGRQSCGTPGTASRVSAVHLRSPNGVPVTFQGIPSARMCISSFTPWEMISLKRCTRCLIHNELMREGLCKIASEGKFRAQQTHSRQERLFLHPMCKVLRILRALCEVHGSARPIHLDWTVCQQYLCHTHGSAKPLIRLLEREVARRDCRCLRERMQEGQRPFKLLIQVLAVEAARKEPQIPYGNDNKSAGMTTKVRE